jgi:hypothetical protein
MRGSWLQREPYNFKTVEYLLCAFLMSLIQKQAAVQEIKGKGSFLANSCIFLYFTYTFYSLLKVFFSSPRGVTFMYQKASKKN